MSIYIGAIGAKYTISKLSFIGPPSGDSEVVKKSGSIDAILEILQRAAWGNLTEL